jgi:hypothetical protein
MVRIDIVGDKLIVNVLGWHRVWALKRRIEIPLEHVESVSSAAGLSLRPSGLRFPGSYFPGVISAGSYYAKDGWSFWDVRHIDRAIVLTVRDEHYKRLVVEVERSEETIEQVRRAIEGHR